LRGASGSRRSAGSGGRRVDEYFRAVLLHIDAQDFLIVLPEATHLAISTRILTEISL
jgi:hypothetical protein